jgi:hypothetical protein
MALSRILIVKLSSLGDVVHGVPVAGAGAVRRLAAPQMPRAVYGNGLARARCAGRR